MDDQAMCRFDLMKFCYDLYTTESRRRERFASLAGLFLGGIVILCGAWNVAFGGLASSPELLVVGIPFWLAVILAIYQMIRMMWPREYSDLGSMTDFLSWRERYLDELQEAGYDAKWRDKAADDAFCDAVTKQLSDVIRDNREQNEFRRTRMCRAIYYIAAATIWLAIATAGLQARSMIMSDEQPQPTSAPSDAAPDSQPKPPPPKTPPPSKVKLKEAADPPAQIRSDGEPLGK